MDTEIQLNAYIQRCTCP